MSGISISKYEIANAHFASIEANEFQMSDVTWCGEILNCDVCSRPMDGEKYMIDGPVAGGPYPFWGNLCVVCAYKSSPRIGWGIAQLYRRENSNWRLIAGDCPGKND